MAVRNALLAITDLVRPKPLLMPEKAGGTNLKTLLVPRKLTLSISDVFI